ncbi:MAG: sulfite exporter TauE/SafE family protein [Planctomycetota bacterium]
MITTLVIAVFLASVLGSLHCVGMCGAFLALAFTDLPESGRWRVSAAYHGGRLVSYTALGIAAGTAGSLLDLGGTLAGINQIALPLAGITVIGFGVVGLLRQRGVSIQRFHLPPAWAGRVHRLQSLAMQMQPTQRAAAIGMLTTLLPCGWLYAFAATAGGTASPLLGGLVMVVFWSGTLPALVSCGVGVQALAGRFGKRLPELTCVALIVFGGLAVFGRSQFDIPDLTSQAWAAHGQTASVLASPDDGSASSITLDPATGLLIEPDALRCHGSSAREAKP